MIMIFVVSSAFSVETVLKEDLVNAVRQNDIVAVKKAVEADPSIVRMTNPEGKTLLLLAASTGKLEIAKFLLESGSDIEARDRWGRTPLLSAARETGGIDVIKLLVEKGAAVTAVDDGWDSALMLAAWRGFEDIVDYLLEKGANVPSDDEQKTWLLFEAADKGLDKLFSVIIAKGADLNVRGEGNATLLHMACGGGSLPIIDMLLKSNVSPNLKDASGWTPLHYAAYKGKTDVIELMIRKGADINARTLVGETPFNIASAWGTGETVKFLEMKGADNSPVKFPKLTGEYMGMTKPGDKPEPFGEGIIINHFEPHSTIVFSPDGKEAFWTVMLPPQDKGYASNALMHSKMIGDTWTYPVPMRFQKTGIKMDVPVFSFDGSKLYFISSAIVNPEDKTSKERIWFSERQGDSWGEPKPLDEKVNSFPMHWQFSFDRHGNLYFSYREKMSFSKFTHGKFEEPEDLQKVLGKEKLEGNAPFFAPDGSYLIFSVKSEGRPTMNLAVMFKKKDGTWTDPVDIGNGINTPGHELCPIVAYDGKYLFYTSNMQYYWVKADIIEQLRKSTLKE